MKPLFAALLQTGLCVCAWAGEDAPAALQSEADRLNYSVGYRVGSDLKAQGAEVEAEMLVRGIADALSGTVPALSAEEMWTSLAALQQKAIADAEGKRQETLARLREEGRAFLAENAKKEGVVALPSGLQYRVLESGNGPSPKAEDTVTVDYKGTLIDGTEFDSSFKRGEPATFPVQGVIAGWTEALQRMKVGDHWELLIPAELAYGDQGQLAGRALIFDVKLLAVQAAGQGEAPADTEAAAKGRD
jgi:FKBP-type peptidyl-prolyl cis-trans isomerase FklB